MAHLQIDYVVLLQGRATVEMGLTFKTARDNGIKGGTLRIVRLFSTASPIAAFMMNPTHRLQSPNSVSNWHVTKLASHAGVVCTA